jgi:RNA polymerase sigma-70 factor (ECF subfamily)
VAEDGGTGREEGLEASSFEALVADHSAHLYRFARSLVRDPDAAEDLVQEAFVRAFERRAQFRGDAPVRAWLRRILHNVAVDRARRSREIAVGRVEDLWRDDAYTVDAAAVVERTESREELEDALVRLPFIYRSAVVLHDVEGWTTERIAETLGIGRPAAKQRLRRGRMMLVTTLAEGHERRARLAGVPLRCWEARSRVSDYLDGELPEAERRLVERHLETCPTCPPLYACLVGACGGLGRLRDPDTVIPPQLAERVVERVRAQA